MTYILLLGLSLLATRAAAVENILGTLTNGGSFYYDPDVDITVIRDSNGIKVNAAKGKCRPIEHNGIGACDMKICNPINTFDEEKKYCKFPAGKSNCDHYCERRSWKYYHQPVPLEGSQRCNGNDCYIEEGWVNATEIGTTLEESTTTTGGAGITGQIGSKGGSFGGTLYVESSYTRGVGYTTTKGTSNTLNMGQSFKGEHDKFEGARCGRWKAVPVMIRSKWQTSLRKQVVILITGQHVASSPAIDRQIKTKIRVSSLLPAFLEHELPAPHIILSNPANASAR